MRIRDWSPDVCASGLLVDARVAQQAHAVIERSGDRCHQHRLLGVGRAAEPAVADVPAAAHVARYRFPMQAEFLAAVAQHGVVGVRFDGPWRDAEPRSEEHTSELQSLMRISYAVFCLKKNN